eukprot:jgi/Mesen1/2450/ME000158S01644
MYFGAAVAMLFLPGLVASRGPKSVFQLVAALGAAWAVMWMRYSTDPPGGATSFAPQVPEKQKHAHAEESGEVALISPTKRKVDHESVPQKRKGAPKEQSIPWVKIFLSWPVWAIVVNNFTFHYALYVLMNWLPTYFDQGLHASLSNMGFSKMLPYFVMFIFSNVGGVIADHLITKRICSVTYTRKLLNTIGFAAAAVALMVMPHLASVSGAVLCSSVALGACALARAGFAVNHLDIAPRYAGIVMGVSNTAGTIAGVVGVAATGLILEASKEGSSDRDGWKLVFATPAILCVLSSVIFCAFATGERLFD